MQKLIPVSRLPAWARAFLRDTPMADETKLSLEDIQREKIRAAEMAAKWEALERVTLEREKLLAELKPATQASSTDLKNNASQFTLAWLIQQYRSDPQSTLHTVTYNTRVHYESLLKLIEEGYGSRVLWAIDMASLQSMHDAWAENGKTAAHAKVAMLRTLFSFGIEKLNDDQCSRLLGLLTRMSKKIAAPKGRSVALTREQADAIRSAAFQGKKKRGSLALAQAFQFDVGMMQRDVLGEWVPSSEDGVSEVITTDSKGGSFKWVRGIRWNEIDDRLILRHPTGTRGDIVFDLHNAPMVLDEFKRQFNFDHTKHGRARLPAKGPIIVSEWTDLPWTAAEFRRIWRVLADRCGIPDNVRSMDSRTKASGSPNENRSPSAPVSSSNQV